MEKVESFLKKEYINGGGSDSRPRCGSICGYGYASGFGSGSGNGDGTGDGYGSICGYGDGSGYGYGSTFGYGAGYGFGTGDGDGSGLSSGSGNGDGTGDGSGVDGILQFNSFRVFVIDGIQTVIKKVIGDFAKGFIINKDLTTETCYVAKSGNTFAHGKTIHEAHEALMEKLLEEMPVEERLENFLKEFSGNKKFKVIEFYKWHHILTGSCKFGRDQFAKEHGIDLENDEFTVKEFVELTKNSYGGDIIKEIERRISDV